MSGSRIALHGAVPPTVVPPDDVYFTFASGRLAYNCETCRATCCRGHGFNIPAPSDMDRHLRSRPPLRFFVDRRPGPIPDHGVRNCAPGCFFLNEAGLCTIQIRDGYARKPEVCRLFPFNRIWRLGRYLVVAPHDGLCPLEVVMGGPPSPLSSHEALRAEMASQGIVSKVPEYRPIHAGIDALVALERRIVALAESHRCAGTGYERFAAAQLSAAAALGLSPRPHGNRDGWEERAVESFLGRVSAVLDVPRNHLSTRDPDLTQTLIALTPTLRAELVFVAPAERHTIRVQDVPYAMLVLYALALLARSAGMSRITLQTLYQLSRQFRSLTWLLVHSEQVTMWHPEAEVELRVPDEPRLQAQWIRLAKALLPPRQQRVRARLGDVLEDVNRSTGLARVEFLRLAAARLEGRLVPVDPPPARPARRAFRNRMQQWILGHLSERVLADACAAAASPATGGRR